ELEQSIRRDPGLLLKPLAVDLERGRVEEVVGMADPALAKPPGLVGSDPANVLECFLGHRAKACELAKSGRPPATIATFCIRVYDAARPAAPAGPVPSKPGPAPER